MVFLQKLFLHWPFGATHLLCKVGNSSIEHRLFTWGMFHSYKISQACLEILAEDFYNSIMSSSGVQVDKLDQMWAGNPMEKHPLGCLPTAAATGVLGWVKGTEGRTCKWLQMPTVGRKVKNGKQQAVSQKLQDLTSALTRKRMVDQFWKEGENPKHSLYFSQRELEKAKSSVKERELMWALGETRRVQRPQICRLPSTACTLSRNSTHLCWLTEDPELNIECIACAWSSKEIWIPQSTQVSNSEMKGGTQDSQGHCPYTVVLHSSHCTVSLNCHGA